MKTETTPELKETILRLLDSRTDIVGSGMGQKPLALVERFWLEKLSKLAGDIS